MWSRLAVLIAAAIGFPAISESSAQQYPARPIRLIIPFAAGGGADITGRLLARKLSDAYDQQVVVDNRAGAGTVIGSDILSKSPPDGYTLLLQVNALASNHTLYAKLPYDTLRDFTAIVKAATTPHVLVLHLSVPAKSVQEFMTYANAHPDKLSYASSGLGGTSYLATELLKLQTGIKMVHVPYKGSSPALNALLSTETQVMVPTLPPAIAFVRAGRLRALGVTSAERSVTMPELLTLIEGGVPGYDFATWYGLFAPAKTPVDIVAKLNATVIGLLNDADFTTQLARNGLEPGGGSPQAFDAYFRSEIEKLGKVIRATGLKAE